MFRLNERLIWFKAALLSILVIGFGLANLWRFLPEFNYLEKTWSTPVMTQVAILIISGLYIIFSNKLHWYVILPIALFSTGSWYSITFSESTNSITSRLGPVPLQESQYKNITSISLHNYSMSVHENTSRSFSLGVYPFGINSSALREYLLENNQCLSGSASNCNHISFEWP